MESRGPDPSANSSPLTIAPTAPLLPRLAERVDHTDMTPIAYSPEHDFPHP
jgi:hypothetical protein